MSEPDLPPRDADIEARANLAWTTRDLPAMWWAQWDGRRFLPALALLVPVGLSVVLVWGLDRRLAIALGVLLACTSLAGIAVGLCFLLKSRFGQPKSFHVVVDFSSQRIIEWELAGGEWHARPCLWEEAGGVTETPTAFIFDGFGLDVSYISKNALTTEAERAFLRKRMGEIPLR